MADDDLYGDIGLDSVPVDVPEEAKPEATTLAGTEDESRSELSAVKAPVQRKKLPQQVQTLLLLGMELLPRIKTMLTFLLLLLLRPKMFPPPRLPEHTRHQLGNMKIPPSTTKSLLGESAGKRAKMAFVCTLISLERFSM